MRVKRTFNRPCRLPNLVILVLLFNIVFMLHFIFTRYNSDIMIKSKSKLSFLFTDFEVYENLISKSVKEIHEKFQIKVVVYSEERPYPPLMLPTSPEVSLVLSSDLMLKKSYTDNHLEDILLSQYVVIMPDGIFFNKDIQIGIFENLFHHLSNKVRILAIPTVDTDVKCVGLKFKLKHWTLQYYMLNGSIYCDAVFGIHIIIMKTSDFFQLTRPLLRPLNLSIYAQSVTKNWKVMIIKVSGIYHNVSLYQDSHSKWKHEENEILRAKTMYKLLGVKLVQTSDGKEQWYGCSKDTQRCFRTIVNDMPEYIYNNRWTPPCCLKHIRTTAKYVFNILKTQGVRYWLEGGSLLGAARNGDIIPWDYDVDIGIYKEDISRSLQLTAAMRGPFEDEYGFLWEKAQEGEHIRVQFSQTNHLHIDIFPFYSRNGIMTKDKWLITHKQDTEFPEHFLTPLETINFIGISVSVPNNWKRFLELKFGKGVIDHPKYPNSEDVLEKN